MSSLIAVLTVVLPSATTIILAFMNKSRKKFFKDQFQQLTKTVFDGFDKNQAQHLQIKQQLTVQGQVVMSHTKQITKYLQQQTISSSLRQVAKHAIEYCGNRDLGKILDKFIQQLIAFVQDITTIGFQNTTKQQILIKLMIAQDNSNNFASPHIFDTQTIQR